MTCGICSLISASVSVGNSTLSATIMNNSTGNGNIRSFDYFIGRNNIASSPGLDIGQTHTYTVPIPPWMNLTKGHVYTVTVEAYFPGATDYRSLNVTAS